MRKPILFLLYFIVSTAYRTPVASDPTRIPRTVSIGPASNGDVIPKYSRWIDQGKRSGKDMPLNYPITGITQEQAIRFCKWKEGAALISVF